MKAEEKPIASKMMMKDDQRPADLTWSDNSY